jgi:O-antigen/teichoic acid export membrane protein
MFAATSVANFSAYLLHVFMSRMLGPAEYAVFVSLLSVFMVVSVPVTPIQTVVARYTAEFKALGQYGQLRLLLTDLLGKLVGLGVLIGALFVLVSGPIAAFLRIPSSIPVMVVGTMVLVSMLSPVALGALQGLQDFTRLGAYTVAAAVIRLILGVALAYVGLGASGALAASTLSTALVFLLALLPLRPLLKPRQPPGLAAPDRSASAPAIFGYLASVFVALGCFTALTNVDVVLVKHFFDPVQSGHYSAASMVGKMILYLPGAVAIVMFPKASERSTLNQDTLGVLYNSLLVVGLISGAMVLIYFIFPAHVVRFLFGVQYVPAAPLVGIFGLSMAFYGLLNILLFYFLSIKEQRFLLLLVGGALAEIILLLLFHSAPEQIIVVVGGVGLAVCLAGICLARWAAKGPYGLESTWTDSPGSYL